MYQTCQRGDDAKCLDMAQEKYPWAVTRFGEKDPQTLTSLNNLAAIYHGMNHMDEAEALYFRVLALQQEVLEEKYSLTLVTHDNLGGL